MTHSRAKRIDRGALPRRGIVRKLKGDTMNDREAIKARLEYLRGEIEAERISYGEIAELESLAAYIEPDDVQLLEWAGVPERAGL